MAGARGAAVRARVWGEAAGSAFGAPAAVVAAGTPDDTPNDAPNDTPDAEDRDARGNLTRYLRWQARDWTRHRGAWIGALVLAVLVTAWTSYDAGAAASQYQARLAHFARAVARGQPSWPVQTPFQALSENFLFWTAFLSVCGSVMATFGIVARERELGLQRFLFAKPVNVRRYYVQKFAVAGAGQIAIALAASLLASLAFHAALPVASAVGIAAAAFAVLGALTFFFSTLTRFDGAATLAALLASWFVFMIAAYDEQHAPSGAALVARAAQWLLPPIRAVEAFAGSGPRLMSVAFAVAWIACYAAVVFAAGLAVLRRRSITT